MAIISIRFNDHEEKIVNILTKHYHEDRSKILKKSIYEMYENLLDHREIEAFEKREEKGLVQFHTADEILLMTSKKRARPTRSKK